MWLQTFSGKEPILWKKKNNVLGDVDADFKALVGYFIAKVKTLFYSNLELVESLVSERMYS